MSFIHNCAVILSYKLQRGQAFQWIDVRGFLFFFPPIWWGRWTGGDHAQQDLAKCGYKSEWKEEIIFLALLNFGDVQELMV